MTNSPKRPTRILLLTALAVVLSWFLYTGVVMALENFPGQTWEVTQTAAQKQAAGDCTSTMVCRELCYYGVPQGQFMCFNN